MHAILTDPELMSRVIGGLATAVAIAIIFGLATLIKKGYEATLAKRLGINGHGKESISRDDCAKCHTEHDGNADKFEQRIIGHIGSVGDRVERSLTKLESDIRGQIEIVHKRITLDKQERERELSATETRLQKHIDHNRDNIEKILSGGTR